MQYENMKDDWGDDTILKISGKELNRYLVRKHLGKICTCQKRVILIDTNNRRCECSECGAILDPFDILSEITSRDHLRYNYLKYLKQEQEELEKWKLNNRMGFALRQIASNIRRGLIPCCPHCNEPFDIEKLPEQTWMSKEYAEALYEQKLLKRRNNND